MNEIEPVKDKQPDPAVGSSVLLADELNMLNRRVAALRQTTIEARNALDIGLRALYPQRVALSNAEGAELRARYELNHWWRKHRKEYESANH